MSHLLKLEQELGLPPDWRAYTELRDKWEFIFIHVENLEKANQYYKANIDYIPDPYYIYEY